MSARTVCLALAASAALCASSPGPARGQTPARVDRHGDPLPQGAVARLGTARFRLLGNVRPLGFAADNQKLLLFRNPDLLQSLDLRTGDVRPPAPPARNDGSSVYVYYGYHSSLLSGDGRALLLSEGSSEDLGLVDVATGKERGRIPMATVFPPVDNGVSISGLLYDLSHDGRLLAVKGQTVGKRMQLAWFDVTRAKQLYRVSSAEGASFTLLAFARDGGTLAAVEYSADGKERLRLWDTAGGKELKAPDVPGVQVRGLALMPDGKSLLVTGGPEARHVSLLDAATGKEIRRFTHDEGVIGSFRLAPDGKLLCALSPGQARVWDVATGKPARVIRHPDLAAGATAFLSHDGKTLAAAARSRVLAWDLATGRELCPAPGQSAPVGALAFAPSGKQLVAADGGAGPLLWDLAPAAGARRLSAGASPDGKGDSRARSEATQALFSGDGRLVSACSSSTPVNGWAAATGKPVPMPPGADQPEAMAAAPDGRLLACAGGGLVKIWDLTTGKETRRFTWEAPKAEGERVGRVSGLAFSPDGKSLAACGTIGGSRLGGGSPRARVWEVAAGQERLEVRFVRDLRGEDAGGRFNMVSHSAMGIGFLPHGRTVAVSDARGVYLADAVTGKELRHLTGPLLSPGTVAFSPDGRLAAAGQSDGSLRLWRADTGAVLGDVSGGEWSVGAVAFSPDGKWLASGSVDTTILLWDVAHLVKSLSAAPRSLSAKALAALWDDLAGGDAARAHQAIGEFAGAPAATVPFFKARLRPVAPVGAERIEQLLADLESRRFADRDRATRELERVLDQAGPALERALAANPPLETRQRVEALLARLSGPISAPEVLRSLRAVEALERIGTDEARALLRSLAGGAADARLTREADAALRRLARRPAAAPDDAAE